MCYAGKGSAMVIDMLPEFCQMRRGGEGREREGNKQIK